MKTVINNNKVYTLEDASYNALLKWKSKYENTPSEDVIKKQLAKEAYNEVKREIFKGQEYLIIDNQII